jgi:hypothetical protein
MALGMGLVVTHLADCLPFPTDQLVGSNLVLLFAFPSAMAFVIGGCVPHIYRSARRAATARRNEARQLVAFTPPDSLPSATQGSSIGRDGDGRGPTDMHQQPGEAARQQGERAIAGTLTARIRTRRGKQTGEPMAGQNARDDRQRVATVEQLIGKREGGGTNSDAVEPAKLGTDQRAYSVELGERDHDERQAAQPAKHESAATA